MVTKKELDATGLQVGSRLEIEFKTQDIQKCYFIEATMGSIGITDKIQTARAMLSSQHCAYSYMDYSKIKAFKVLKKELGPVTKKELLDFGVKESSKLEVIVFTSDKRAERTMGYVSELNRSTLYLVGTWDDGAKKQANPCSGTEIPYKNIAYYTSLGADAID